MEKDGEMSSKRDKNVLQEIEKLVEKYKRDYPALDKRGIRQFVLGDLAQKKIRIDKNSSQYRKLSRCLTIAFEKEERPTIVLVLEKPQSWYKPTDADILELIDANYKPGKAPLIQRTQIYSASRLRAKLDKAAQMEDEKKFTT